MLIGFCEARGGGQNVSSPRPQWVTFTPDSKAVYVSLVGAKLVRAIDVKTIKVVASFPVGEAPTGSAR